MKRICATKIYIFTILLIVTAHNLQAQVFNWNDKVQVFYWKWPSEVPNTGCMWGHALHEESYLRECVQYYHQNNKCYISGMTLGHGPRRSNLNDSLACIDIDGNPIYEGELLVPNILNPAYQDSLITWGKAYIDLGTDGFQIDGYWPNITAIDLKGGSFDDYTINAFRNYLNESYSYNILVSRFDIDDINNFHFKNWIIDHGLAEEWNEYPFFTSYPIKYKLVSEFWLFCYKISNEFYEKWTQKIKDYAKMEYNKNIVIANNMADAYFFSLQFDDFQTGELLYSWTDSIHTSWAAPYIKKCKSINDNPIVLLPEMIKRTQDQIFPEYSDNIYKFILADIYASNAYSMVYDHVVVYDHSKFPVTDRALYVNEDVSTQYSSFILKNGYLYEKLTPVSNVGLVFSYSSEINTNLAIENPHYKTQVTSHNSTSKLLIESNIQHNSLFFTDDRLMNDNITIEKLSKYKCIILPNVFSMTDNQVNMILQYVSEGGIVVAFGETGTYDEYGNLVNRSVLGSLTQEGTNLYGNGKFVYFNDNIGRRYADFGNTEDKQIIYDEIKKHIQPTLYIKNGKHVSAFAYKKENTSKQIVHIVNYGYNLYTDQFPIYRDVILKILVDTTKSWEAVCISPDFFGEQVLNTIVDSSYLNITIPRLEAYDIIILQENLNAPEIVARFPESNPTILAGDVQMFEVSTVDSDENPIYFRWFVNGKVDSTCTDSVYYYNKSRAYTGVDTIKVEISDGSNHVQTEWLVSNRTYTFPRVIFDETHSPHFSPDSSRAIQILIDDEGLNYDPDHIEWVLCDKLINRLRDDFIVESDTLSPLLLDDSIDDVLFMVPMNKDISNEEKVSISNFIENGGGMIILSTPYWGNATKNENSNIYQLFNLFGFKRSPYLLLGYEFPQDEYVSGFPVYLKGEHPATNKSQILVHLGHKLETTSDFAQIIETTGNVKACEDLNGNHEKDDNEPILSNVGIIGISEYGKGRVVYITWHMFANDSEYKPNYDLVSDAIKWVAENVNKIPSNVENTFTNIPRHFDLKQNYPNPFNPVTKIEFLLSKQCNVEIKIYNMLGQEIRTLIDRTYSAGNHLVVWDGTNNLGNKVTSGLYLYSMKAGNFVKVKKGLLLK